jgi:hypothetical protein
MACSFPCDRCGGRRLIRRKEHPDADDLGFVCVCKASDMHRPDGRTMVLTDRYMEGTKSLDGVDIGSHAKRSEYMKRRGLVDFNELKGEPEYQARQREERFREKRREVLIDSYKKLAGY